MTAPDDGRPFPRVDALFGGEPALPPLDPTPRLRRILLLLAVGIPLDLMGVTCFTGVPGALLTLWAYLLTDAEQALADADRYPDASSVESLGRLRRLARWAMVFTIGSLVLQIFLFTATNFYGAVLLPVVERLLAG